MFGGFERTSISAYNLSIQKQVCPKNLNFQFSNRYFNFLEYLKFINLHFNFKWFKIKITLKIFKIIIKKSKIIIRVSNNIAI